MDSLLLPLYELFLQVREPLGLRPDQYVALLEALELGFGCAGGENYDDLREVCRLLWAKTPADGALFDREFSAYLARLPQEGASVRSGKRDSSEFGEKGDLPPIGPLPKAPKRGTRASPSPKQAPARVAAAYRGLPDPPLGLTESQHGFVLVPSEFPFELRPARYRWRKLRRVARAGRSEEIDVVKAVQAVARERCCFELPYLPQRENRLELVFLEDREGSMMPFRTVADRLVETVERQQFEQVRLYYFRNCPREVVYEKPKGTDEVPLEALRLGRRCSVVVVLSDAGAARGGYSPGRVDTTRTFLQSLRLRTWGVAWLNPMPRRRWTGTTAEAIAQVLEEVMGARMFELSEDGLMAALEWVRG
ncbi:hypothetical protein KR51_00019310 [Rubidibacter lacunae KORDI 51-2]|uniref:VWA domain containing CoxE-like protein n=2 Tax=Rubidibacter TaxID=582491 RepID=U5DLB1_9CHRO|nr:hypothetical protein KR51_00019310 [Rubidibacter lacunae KORDI 51-2]